MNPLAGSCLVPVVLGQEQLLIIRREPPPPPPPPMGSPPPLITEIRQDRAALPPEQLSTSSWQPIFNLFSRQPSPSIPTPRSLRLAPPPRVR